MLLTVRADVLYLCCHLQGMNKDNKNIMQKAVIFT